jgi:hypothetical protein
MNGKPIRHLAIIIGCSMGLMIFLLPGCSSIESVPRVSETKRQQVPVSSLVMPSAQTLEVLGPEGLISSEMHAMNMRKDRLLGADLPPVAVPVNLSQVYIRDQQWILNGRPWENYMQTTRSLQLKSR